MRDDSMERWLYSLKQVIKRIRRHQLREEIISGAEALRAAALNDAADPALQREAESQDRGSPREASQASTEQPDAADPALQREAESQDRGSPREASQASTEQPGTEAGAVTMNSEMITIPLRLT